MKYKVLFFIAAVALLAALAATSSVLAQNNYNGNPQQTADESNDLAGTWLTKLTPPPEGPPPFQGIFTFIGDGSLIATQAGGEFPALGNPQLGLWARNPGNKRQFTLTYYGQDFDDHFQLTDSYRVRGTLNLNASGTSFTGTLDITVYDLDGNEVFSDCCAAFEGNRGGLGSPNANANYIPSLTGLSRSQGWSRHSTKPRP